MSATPIDLEALALRHGTPFFLYDLDRVRAAAGRAKRALPPSTWINYALKANPHPRIVAALRGLVDGIDVSSAPEIDVALAAGFDGHQLTFSGPGKTAEAVRRADAAGARITAEAIDQLKRLRKLAPTARVALRVNPDERINAYRVAMGGVPSPFGIDEVLLEEARDLAPPHIGIQVFAGSEVSSVAGVLRSVSKTLDIVEQTDGVNWVSFGGGLTPDFDIEALGTKLGRMLEKFCRAMGNEPSFGFELGRHLVGDAGIYVARVVSTKTSRGTRFVVLDGGMNHNLFGMGLLGGRPHSLFNISNVEGTATEVVVCGPLCTPLDRHGDVPVPLAEPRVGDLVMMQQCGAYGLTASPQAFIGHTRPAELFAADGVVH